MVDKDYVVLSACSSVLREFRDATFQMIYIDPPFNTGKVQQRRTIQTVRNEEGDRTGFGGNRYATTELSRRSYLDVHDDYLDFLSPLLAQAKRLLTDSGALYFHIDYREAHYVKLLLDSIFGREAFLNEIIWAYDFGGRAKDRWPAKHDTIFVYVKTPGKHFFDQQAVERIPYMAPGLVGPDKAARGKLPTDVMWQTIVPTNGKEKTGYPNQKPEALIRRFVQASTKRGDRVLDFFAGSGTLGSVARQLERRFVLVDKNPEAVEVIRKRLGTHEIVYMTYGLR